MNLNDNLSIENIEIGKVAEVLSQYSLAGNTLFITSKSFSQRGVVASCRASLTQCDLFLFDQVAPNPQISQIEGLVNKYAQCRISNIIALGGGSVLDTAKVLSRWLADPQKPFEQMLSTESHDIKTIPVIAMPTTAGTGAEVTPFATVWDNEEQKKFSVLGVKPANVILDAELTLTLPRQETLYSALDALSHSLESIWNTNCTEESKKRAGSAIDLICEGLPKVLQYPDDIASRSQLLVAASMAGLAISTTKTAIAHAISYPLTLRYGMPHGLACSFSLLAIIDGFDNAKLNLTSCLVDKVKRLLFSLNLEKEVQRFVDWSTLLSEFETELDPARAGNFSAQINSDKIIRLLEDSQHSVDEVSK